MDNERLKVLELLEKGAVSAEEATRLLDAIDEKHNKEEKRMQLAQENRNIQGKKLRVEVLGDTEETKNMNVNVSIPLVLARHVDDIIANLVPNAANEELKKEGIDLRGIKLGAIVDSLEGLDEDIVNADIDQEENHLKVRVYVE